MVRRGVFSEKFDNLSLIQILGCCFIVVTVDFEIYLEVLFIQEEFST